MVSTQERWVHMSYHTYCNCGCPEVSSGASFDLPHLLYTWLLEKESIMLFCRTWARPRLSLFATCLISSLILNQRYCYHSWLCTEQAPTILMGNSYSRGGSCSSSPFLTNSGCFVNWDTHQNQIFKSKIGAILLSGISNELTDKSVHQARCNLTQVCIFLQNVT